MVETIVTVLSPPDFRNIKIATLAVPHPWGGWPKIPVHLLLSLSILLIISNLEETVPQFARKTIVQPETHLNLTSSTT